MFTIPGVLSQSPKILTPQSTVLYIKGNSLNDLSSYSPKTIIGHSNAENAITFDTSDTIYDSIASMVFPSTTSSYLKYSGIVQNVSLGNSPWTMEMWIKRLGSDVRMDVLTFLPPNPTMFYALQPCLNTNGSIFAFWEHNGGVRNITSITQNSWVHLAICRQSDNTVKIFRNGTQFISATYSRDNTSFNNLYLGTRAFGTAVAEARSSFKLAHLHIATECYYTSNFTANKATGFS